MIIVVESGSTKTDWRIIKPDGIQIKYCTEGFNPNYNPESLLSSMVEHINMNGDTDGAVSLFFYGAGCSSKISIKKVTSAIKKVLPTINIEIQHDLFGAARALYGSGTGIVSILGTGASSCLFVNGGIIETVPSLGFLLGDEGSGIHLGKLLLNAFFKKSLPPTSLKRFRKNISYFWQSLFRSSTPILSPTAISLRLYRLWLKTKKNPQSRNSLQKLLMNSSTKLF